MTSEGRRVSTVSKGPANEASKIVGPPGSAVRDGADDDPGPTGADGEPGPLGSAGRDDVTTWATIDRPD